MAWETRGKRDYLYRKKRVNGRVVSEYIGTGYQAELVARLEAIESQQAELVRDAERNEHHQQATIDAEIKQHGGRLRHLVNAVLVAAGYHQHKRQWRKKRMIRISAPAELTPLLRKASGDKAKGEDLDALQTAMVKYPEAAAQLGILSLHIQATIMHRIFGDSERGMKLAVNEHASQLKQQLGYDTSNALEKALIDHAIVCWLRLAEAETRYEALQSENNVTITRQEHWEKRLAMAQHRYLKAVESLAKVRRLLSAVPLAQINVNSQVLNAGTVQR